MGLIVGKMADFGFLLASWVACLWLWNFWVYDFMSMKFSKFMGCYDFLGFWGFYEFFFFGIFEVVCVMLCSELGIFIALAFVKMPWMMTGDCGWATVFFFFFWGTNWQWVWVLGKKKKAAPSDWHGAHKQGEKYWVMTSEWWCQTGRVF